MAYLSNDTTISRRANFSSSEWWKDCRVDIWCALEQKWEKRGPKNPGKCQNLHFSQGQKCVIGNGAQNKKNKHLRRGAGEFRRGAGGFRRFLKPKHEWRAGRSPPETCGGSKFSKSSPPGLAGPATAELADLGLPQNPRALGNRSEITKFDFLDK